MIRIELNQQRLKGGQKFPISRLKAVEKAVSNGLKLKKIYSISAAFISEKEMTKLNFHFRGKKSVTDVLSFTLSQPEQEGEILLSYEQAKRQAKEMRHSVQDEIVFLLVHGLLHVFGFDHEIEKEAKKMFPLQTRILQKLGVDPRL